jgi:ribosome-binding factor A
MKWKRGERDKVTTFTANKTGAMQEGKRQKQIGGLLQEELSTLFQRLGLNMIDGGMVSISSVKLTPDLLEARIYLSFFQVADAKATLKKIEERAWEVKRELAARIKQQLRRIPELKFFQDDTLEHVFKMEDLFKQIKQDDNNENGNSTQESGA